MAWRAPIIFVSTMVPLMALPAHAQDAAPGPEAMPAATPASPPAAQAPKAQRAPETFAVEAFDVSGVTLLSPEEVETLVYPFAGPDRSQKDVEGARKAIQDAYIAKGFEAVVVDIPVQPAEMFGQGVVQLAVSEVPVGRVRVTGSKYHSLSVTREQVPSLIEGRPVNFKALQADIASANRFPDRTISPSFKAGAVPGTIDVDLKVDDQRPWHASVEVTNDNSPSTTPLRVTATGRYTNLWQAGHSFSFTYGVAPQRRSDSEVFSASYVAPLIGTPWSIALQGYRSNSNIASLGGSNVLGNGYQIGLRAIYRLPSDKTVQTISFGPDFKDFKQDIFVDGVLAGRAPIRYIPFVVEYDMVGATEKSSYAIHLGVTTGLRTIKKTICDPEFTGNCFPVDQFRNREVDSNENFVHGNITIDYSRILPKDFIASLRLAAQISDSHLITNEQFSGGGMQSVRGYYVSEAVGDDGVTGSVEVRSPSFASLFGKFVTEARLYGFVDGGYIHVQNALPEQQADFKLVSVGGGARIRLFDMLSGEVLVGVPLISGPVSKRGHPRITFLAKGEF